MKNCFAGWRKHTDSAVLFMRLAVGAIFIFHGVMKWKLWGQAPTETPATMMDNLMKFLSIVEPLGGLALVIGFLTEWAAMGLGIIMLGAIYLKQFTWGIGFAAANAAGWEFDLVLLACCLLLMVYGAGKYAVDRVCCKDK